MTSLADQIIGAPLQGDYVSNDPYDWLERIKEVSPSIYRHHGLLWHEHEVLEKGNTLQFTSLIRSPNVVVSRPQAIWLYDSLYEWAPELNDRYIVVSADFVWDARTGELIPIEHFARRIRTLSDKLTKEIRRKV